MFIYNYIAGRKSLGRRKKKFFLVFRPLRGGGGGLKPPEPLRKNSTFFYKLKKLPKPHQPLSSRGGGVYPGLSGTIAKKPFFYVCFPLPAPGAMLILN